MKNPQTYKSPTQAGTNLQQAANSTAPSKYITGVTNPNVDWAERASSEGAQTAMAAGLSQAISEGRVKAGIQRAGNAKWANNAKVKGGATYGPQLAAAGGPNGAYTQAMGAVMSDLQGAYQAAQAASTAGGFAGNKARMNAYLDYMHEQKVKREQQGGR